MLKKILITGLLLFLGQISNAYTMPVYTDDIPLEHLGKTKKPEIYDTFQNVPEEIKKEENIVNIYSNKTIVPLTIVIKVDGKKVLSENIKINHKLSFLTANDVYKNGKLYIRKDTPVIGIVRAVQLQILCSRLPQYAAPSELEVHAFKTQDINGNDVELYGSVNGVAKRNFLVWLIFGDNASPQAIIKKNKIHTLYYK